MFYYELENKIFISQKQYKTMKEVSENKAKARQGTIYLLHEKNPEISRRSFSVKDPSLVFLEREGIDLLQKSEIKKTLPDWFISRIHEGNVQAINTAYPTWKDALNYTLPNNWKIHIAGMGDVGGTLVTGLRLLGGDKISEIGIYDKNENHTKRWELEINQILSPCPEKKHPKICILSEDKIFDCDLFIFCISVGVPPIGKEKKDVRIAQFEGNKKIVKAYAKMAREQNFKGIFAVVSDPVDLLCKTAFLESNKNDDHHYDFKGLAADQIRGYGLGVMNARAAYYANKDPLLKHYLKEGRAFGPHGEGLIIADSIQNYNEELSKQLTEKAKTANLKVRSTGFKPYIAPAISSGSLSILATIMGDWHYSATFMGGVFMGAKNRNTPTGIEVEKLDLPSSLVNELENTYNLLRSFL
ncbi:lactate/malate family dehydrogenase [Crassaminicella profunda]|uniref:lactate/malate family dehydrogenase n=1 Tax=Crassaminicella profunda TaxID=1286698 RepID=UPI001CA7304C|nr:lactate dehydrogenase [Crassaminicella profunda]QZY57256.1 lactate dehydrogenase [Crassaminicella profunda]